MLDWAKALWNNTHASLDFQRLERRRLQARKLEAAALFSVEEHENKIAVLSTQIDAEAEQQFEGFIRNNLIQREGLCARKAEQERRATLLHRDFKAELESLWDELHEIEERQRDTNSEKRAAHKSRKSAQSDIDWWYRKSDCILINRGKKIPQKSFLWQSHSDLDRAKARRESAYRRLRAAEAKLGDLSREWEDTHAEIERVKSAKQEARILRNEGVSLQTIAQQVSKLEKGIALSSSRISGLREQRHAFISESRQRLGIVDLENEILRLREEHSRFLADFKAPDLVASRRQEHRIAWENKILRKPREALPLKSILVRARWPF